MKRFVLASLLALPILGLHQENASAFFSFTGKNCHEYSFHFPRIMFGIDTGHFHNCNANFLGTGLPPCGPGPVAPPCPPGAGAPAAPWFQQFPSYNWQHLSKQNGGVNAYPAQVIEPVKPLPAVSIPTGLQPASYQAPVYSQAGSYHVVPQYQYPTATPAPSYWYGY
jgi:hypothetical protein